MCNLSASSSFPGPVVLVSGSRHFIDASALWSLLTKLTPSLLVVGDCPTGADELARNWACSASPVPVRVSFHNALWSVWGRSAGPRRNAEMVALVSSLRDLGRDVVCVFCWPSPGVRSSGTRSTFKLAAAAGLPFLELGDRPPGLPALNAAQSGPGLFLDLVA